MLEAHTSKFLHHGMNDTQNIINAQGWLVGSSHYGVPWVWTHTCFSNPLATEGYLSWGYLSKKLDFLHPIGTYKSKVFHFG